MTRVQREIRQRQEIRCCSSNGMSRMPHFLQFKYQKKVGIYMCVCKYLLLLY